MDEWDETGGNLNEEEDEQIFDYCPECDEPIYEGEDYGMTADGRILCESCCIIMSGGRMG